MYHVIKDDIYYLYNNNGIELMRIELTELPGDQLVITVKDEVYSGPVNLISFSGDIRV